MHRTRKPIDRETPCKELYTCFHQLTDLTNETPTDRRCQRFFFVQTGLFGASYPSLQSGGIRSMEFGIPFSVRQRLVSMFSKQWENLSSLESRNPYLSEIFHLACHDRSVVGRRAMHFVRFFLDQDENKIDRRLAVPVDIRQVVEVKNSRRKFQRHQTV